ncbi:MAG: hypothetical protein HFJ44_02275 [Clostridia bacterium]|nr:hypothetical protein [Clostridia bacterium]
MYLEYEKKVNKSNSDIEARICFGCEQICLLKCTGTCALICQDTCKSSARVF